MGATFKPYIKKVRESFDAAANDADEKIVNITVGLPKTYYILSHSVLEYGVEYPNGDKEEKRCKLPDYIYGGSEVTIPISVKKDWKSISFQQIQGSAGKYPLTSCAIKGKYRVALLP